MLNKLKEICRAFRIPGALMSYKEIKIGNVNRTYKVNFLRDDGKEKTYIVQAVNTYVFKKPVEVMDNIDKVTEHIHAKDPRRIALHFHHTAALKTYLFDESGFWRLFNYIPSSTYNMCEDLEIVRNAGVAYGEFQMLLSDFDVHLLHTTIQDFHNTRKRYEQLEADSKIDPCGRVKGASEELNWLMSVREKACLLTDLYDRGELPLRVTHNDTKINNVLFEQEGKRAMVVIDLDTVMPGLVGHDFGDAIRSAANFVEEDSREPERAGVNMAVFREFAEGFLSQTASALTESEIRTLGMSCFGLTCELATRFLDDYILGDHYFKTGYPDHNLVRTRCQVALAKDMLRQMNDMEKIIQNCAKKYRQIKQLA